MAKKPKPPKTFQEVEAFIKLRNLCVDPYWFWISFGDADWYDSNGKPILNWKLKLHTLHKMQFSWGKKHRCSHGSFGSCKKPGVYENGNDRDGHPLYRCIDHKPKWVPSLPPGLTNSMRGVPESRINTNNERNRQMKELAKDGRKKV